MLEPSYLYLLLLLPSIYFFGSWLLDLRFKEKWMYRSLGLVGVSALFYVLLLAYQYLRVGPLPSSHFSILHLKEYYLDLSFRVDLLGILFALLSNTLYLIVLAYSMPYVSREEGVVRFFLLISSVCLGLNVISFSASFDSLALGWEIVGIASVLMISFFFKNERGARSSLYALVSYKFGDAALLAAIGLIHHHSLSTQLSEMGDLEPGFRFWISLLVALATLPKSAQFPFSAWIKRAVEGPSSSTAIFYGALSIHLGPFLLLRTFELWQSQVAVRIVLGVLGAVTSWIATAQSRTRSDAKSVLVASSQAQVGLMYLELALGFKELALLHLVGHAGLRTWQLLRASSLIQDFQDNPALYFWMAKSKGSRIAPKKYIHMLNGYYLEEWVEKMVVLPLKMLLKGKDRLTEPLLITGASIFVSMIFQKYWVEYSGWMLLPVLWLSLRALTSSSLRFSVYTVLLAQFLHLWVSLVGHDSELALVWAAFIVEIPLLGIFLYWVERIHQEYPLRRGIEFYGLYDLVPRAFPIFGLSMALLAGVPIGITYMIEDLVFHASLKSSFVSLFFTVNVLGLITASLLRIVYRLFWGVPEVGIRITPIRKWEMRWTSFALFLYIVFGAFPQLFFDWVRKWV